MLPLWSLEDWTTLIILYFQKNCFYLLWQSAGCNYRKCCLWNPSPATVKRHTAAVCTLIQKSVPQICCLLSVEPERVLNLLVPWEVELCDVCPAGISAFKWKQWSVSFHLQYIRLGWPINGWTTCEITKKKKNRNSRMKWEVYIRYTRNTNLLILSTS